MTSSDPYNLERFVEAQEGSIEIALAELGTGLKQSHWMWFIFPQLADLGRSRMAKFYGISSRDEARAYLEHALLGRRLRQCVEALEPWASSRSAERILGPVDAMKLRSCLTLFEAVEPGAPFDQALVNFFAGVRDQQTLALLNGER